jgi:hypothetical protein
MTGMPWIRTDDHPTTEWWKNEEDKKWEEAAGGNMRCSDFPSKPCRICGKKDRPQWRGICNDGNCST